MSALSHVLYFLVNHFLWGAILAALLLSVVVVGAISRSKAKEKGQDKGRTSRLRRLAPVTIPLFFFLIIPGLMTNFVNGPFLYHCGTEGTAVITHVEVTDSYLNESPIRKFQVVLKTAEGEDVKTRFSTVSATYYPMSNRIYIPPTGERFDVRYIPGAPHNFVMVKPDEYLPKTEAGRCKKAGERVAQTVIQWKSSPDNPTFVTEYREALTQSISACQEASPQEAQVYETLLQNL